MSEHIHKWEVWESSDYDGCPAKVLGLICECGATLTLDDVVEIANAQKRLTQPKPGPSEMKDATNKT